MGSADRGERQYRRRGVESSAWQLSWNSREKGIKGTGAPNLGGPIVTAGGLLFIGATNDRRFRAFDSKTGKELWVEDMPGQAMAVPITYRGE